MLNPLKYEAGWRREGARWWKFSHRPVKFPDIKNSEPHIETARFHGGPPFLYPNPGIRVAPSFRAANGPEGRCAFQEGYVPVSPVTHFLVGWLVANTADLDRRERAVVTIAGVVPDIDGVGAITETLTRHSDKPLLWFSEYHHILAHNLGTALLVAAVSFLVATRRWKTAALAFVSFHLHLLGDLIGGRGPDGYQWPIHYLLPFSDRWQWTWQGQWELNAWPNFVITIAALLVTFYLASKRGYSPLEIFSASADRTFVETLRYRFPHLRSPGH